MAVFKKYFSILLLPLAIVLILTLQSHTNGEESQKYIIRIQDKPITQVVDNLTTILQLRAVDIQTQSIFPDLQMYALTIHNPNKSAAKTQSLLAQSPHILTIEPDVEVSLRNTTPNDPDYNQQWGLDVIDAPSAWDISSGGLTVDGKEIVVAVLDDGFMFDHNDLIDNVWINTAETPGNGIDDDNNGYIDDYYGPNIRSEGGDHPIRRHGTSVAGIVSARSDNSTGVSGVAWNAKLMLISNTKAVSEVILGYNYALAQRRQYERTNGREGAFVVVTNFSGGIDNVFAEDFTAWCDVYDVLGNEGILSVSATTNNDVDIDTAGDMPSTCTSRFLITVNNTVQSDIIARQTGKSSTHIDLGAPGDESYTTALANDYDEFSGTSASTPHVAGAVAMLYSAPCAELINAYRINPQQTALAIKEAIIEGVDKLPSLDGVTVSGGRLNLFNSLLMLDEFCETSRGDLALMNIFPNPVQDVLTVQYESPDFEQYTLQVFDAMGRMVFDLEFNPPAFGQKIESIETHNWNSGVYYVMLSSDDTSVNMPFVKL